MEPSAPPSPQPPVTTLLVRHLPAELSRQDKIDLLCHFGATCARPMGVTGPMRHTAFARYLQSCDLLDPTVRIIDQ